MVNQYLDDYEKNGLIKRKKHSAKTVEYFVTKKGMERKKLLNISYLKSTYAVYDSAKDNIIIFLNQVIEKGYKKLLLYGAGEVAEIMLQTIQNDPSIPVEIVAVIDDDETKIGCKIINKLIISRSKITTIEHDAVLVASYNHHDAIHKKLLELNYDKNKILNFF
jgi:FlaA1/EpsC-like NDP-sugar epimerase